MSWLPNRIKRIDKKEQGEGDSKTMFLTPTCLCPVNDKVLMVSSYQPRVEISWGDLRDKWACKRGRVFFGDHTICTSREVWDRSVVVNIYSYGTKGWYIAEDK